MVNVKGLIFDNFLIKIVSFLVAVGLWLYVTSRGDLEVNFMIPLELKNVPESMMVISGIPGHVSVRLKGRHSAIRGVDAGQIHVVLDLSEARAGVNRYTLMEDTVHVPAAVEVTHISPKTVSLRVARHE
ncbi:MAG: hypothetical protein HZA19_04930 [Nitrospirae bacterium]|nr:hypothetical protein [Nitrospirota bacterium]